MILKYSSAILNKYIYMFEIVGINMVQVNGNNFLNNKCFLYTFLF